MAWNFSSCSFASNWALSHSWVAFSACLYCFSLVWASVRKFLVASKSAFNCAMVAWTIGPSHSRGHVLPSIGHGTSLSACCMAVISAMRSFRASLRSLASSILFSSPWGISTSSGGSVSRTFWASLIPAWTNSGGGNFAIFFVFCMICSFKCSILCCRFRRSFLTAWASRDRPLMSSSRQRLRPVHFWISCSTTGLGNSPSVLSSSKFPSRRTTWFSALMMSARSSVCCIKSSKSLLSPAARDNRACRRSCGVMFRSAFWFKVHVTGFKVRSIAALAFAPCRLSNLTAPLLLSPSFTRMRVILWSLRANVTTVLSADISFATLRLSRPIPGTSPVRHHCSA